MVCTLSKSAAIFELYKNYIISRSLAHVARAQEANTVHCSLVCNSDLLIPAGHVCVIDDIISLVIKLHSLQIRFRKALTDGQAHFTKYDESSSDFSVILIHPQACFLWKCLNIGCISKPFVYVQMLR